MDNSCKRGRSHLFYLCSTCRGSLTYTGSLRKSICHSSWWDLSHSVQHLNILCTETEPDTEHTHGCSTGRHYWCLHTYPECRSSRKRPLLRNSLSCRQCSQQQSYRRLHSCLHSSHKILTHQQELCHLDIEIHTIPCYYSTSWSRCSSIKEACIKLNLCNHRTLLRIAHTFSLQRLCSLEMSEMHSLKRKYYLPGKDQADKRDNNCQHLGSLRISQSRHRMMSRSMCQLHNLLRHSKCQYICRLYE